jgi:hypothetical protein
MARSMRVARALGVVALVSLAACTHEDRRYSYYGNAYGPSYGDGYVPAPYGYGYGPPPDRNGDGPPYGDGRPYKGDYCAFHHCPPKEWRI